MSYSVNWITKVITIPTADLTLVSGTRYSLDMTDFLAEIRRLEWEPTEGLWAPNIVEHTDTRVDFAGANYAPFDEIVNGYTVTVTGAATRVDLLGSNNNLVDVKVDDGVSMVPSNSAGLQVVTTGSALTAGESTQLQETWQFLGLDSAKPVKHTDTEITIGGSPSDITIDVTGDGETESTLTRQ